LVRFLLDENVPRTLGDILRRRGFGVRITNIIDLEEQAVHAHHWAASKG
jgi:hypothetical protein